MEEAEFDRGYAGRRAVHGERLPGPPGRPRQAEARVYPVRPYANPEQAIPVGRRKPLDLPQPPH